MLVLVRHSYCGPSTFAIAGLGFVAALAAAREGFRFVLPAEADASADFCPLFVFGAGALPVFAMAFALALTLACRMCGLRCPALAIFLLWIGFAGVGLASDVPAVFAGRVADGAGAAVMRLISAAGLTPAAMAFLAAAAERGCCFTVPCRSGLTTI